MAATSATSAAAAAAPRAPTIWYGCSVVLDQLGTAEATQRAMDSWAWRHFPNQAPADHKAHATVLYHGPDGAAALRDAELASKYARQMHGAIRCVEKHVGLDGRHFVTMCFDCDGDELQKMHVALRAEAEAISGAKSRQRPHLVDGRSVYPHDVNPHITVATYAADKAKEADAEFRAMERHNGFSAWHGARVTLLPVEEHFG